MHRRIAMPATSYIRHITKLVLREDKFEWNVTGRSLVAHRLLKFLLLTDVKEVNFAHHTWTNAVAIVGVYVPGKSANGGG